MRWVDASEVNSELILRADEMGKELRQLVTEKDEDRAAVLITMDQLDGEEEATIMVCGRGHMLLELCRLMWNDPRTGVALKVFLMSEIEKIRQSDENK